LKHHFLDELQRNSRSSKKEEAKSYNGPIIGIANLGPITAGWLTAKAAMSLGTNTVILLGAAALIPAMALAYLAYKIAGEPQPSEAEKKLHGAGLHLSLFQAKPALLLLALVIALAQGLSCFVQLNYFVTIEQTIPIEDARTAFMGNFWMTVSAASCIFQFVLTPIMLRFLSLRTAMALIPCVHIAIALSLFGSNSLAMAVLAYGGFKVLDYSIFRAGKEIIYIPYSFDVRYRAKQVIDALVYRFSKGIFSGLISMYELTVGVFPQIGYPIMSIVISAGWLAAVFPLTKNENEDSNSMLKGGL